MRRALLLGLLFLGFIGTLNARTVVISVGIDSYEGGWAPPLTSCVNDANGFLNHLNNYNGAKWDERYVATDSNATEEKIRNNIQGFADELVAGDTLVYFHSSHGSTAGGNSACLCCYDSSAFYWDNELAEDLALYADGVKIIIILDACHSGGLFKGAPVVGAQQQGPPKWDFAKNVMDHHAALKAATGTLTKGPSIAFITACDADEQCMAGSPYSLFTHYFLEGFTKADVNNDGTYTFYELFAYAKPLALAGYAGQTAQSFNDTLLQSTAVIGADSPSGGGSSGLPAGYGSLSSGSGGCSVAQADRAPHWSLILPWLLVLTASLYQRRRKRALAFVKI